MESQQNEKLWTLMWMQQH